MREHKGSTMAHGRNFRGPMNEAHNDLEAKGAIKSWKCEQSHRRLDTLCYVIDHTVKAKTKVEATPVKRAGVACRVICQSIQFKQS